MGQEREPIYVLYSPLSYKNVLFKEYISLGMMVVCAIILSVFVENIYFVWVYKIQYPNGWHNDYVAEQDVTNIRNSHYNVGSVVKIANNAYSETNGYTLTNHHKELH